MAHNDKDQKQAKQFQKDVKQDSGLATLNVKPCVKCGSTRRYPPRPGTKTGACIDCANARSKKWEKKHSQRVKEIQRKYKKNNLETWKESKIKSRNKYKAENPDKNKAHRTVANAVKAGKLPRASTLTCVDCNQTAAQCYHHEDYEKPLDVVALCRDCHAKRHS